MNKKYVALAAIALFVLVISIIFVITFTAPAVQADPNKMNPSTSTGNSGTLNNPGKTTINTYRGDIGIYNQGGTLYCVGYGYQQSTTYNIYLVQGTTWTNGMAIPSRIAGSIISVTSDKSGNINDQQLCSSAQPGKYDVIVDVNHNGKYDAGTDVLCQNVFPGTTFLFALPESTFGALAAIGACFASLLVYKRKSLPSLH